MDKVRILPEGDCSLLLVFGQEINPDINRKITAVVKLIRHQHILGLMDIIPSYCAILINYNPHIIKYIDLRRRIEKILRMDINSVSREKRIFDIPVLYGGIYGPDIENIASSAGISVEEVIKIHSSSDYLIYMLGFLPGFCYLGGLDERIHTPRLPNPRLKITAGSVGIGGASTGIYPMDSPGGWQLMGRTPVKTYDPDRKNAILFEAGDYIHFVPVTEERYKEIKILVDKNEYEVRVRKEGE